MRCLFAPTPSSHAHPQLQGGCTTNLRAGSKTRANGWTWIQVSEGYSMWSFEAGGSDGSFTHRSKTNSRLRHEISRCSTKQSSLASRIKRGLGPCKSAKSRPPGWSTGTPRPYPLPVTICRTLRFSEGKSQDLSIMLHTTRVAGFMVRTLESCEGSSFEIADGLSPSVGGAMMAGPGFSVKVMDRAPMAVWRTRPRVLRSYRRPTKVDFACEQKPRGR